MKPLTRTLTELWQSVIDGIDPDRYRRDPVYFYFHLLLFGAARRPLLLGGFLYCGGFAVAAALPSPWWGLLAAPGALVALQLFGLGLYKSYHRAHPGARKCHDDWIVNAVYLPLCWAARFWLGLGLGLLFPDMFWWLLGSFVLVFGVAILIAPPQPRWVARLFEAWKKWRREVRATKQRNCEHLWMPGSYPKCNPATDWAFDSRRDGFTWCIKCNVPALRDDVRYGDDWHGLYYKEAIKFVDQAINEFVQTRQVEERQRRCEHGWFIDTPSSEPFFGAICTKCGARQSSGSKTVDYGRDYRGEIPRLMVARHRERLAFVSALGKHVGPQKGDTQDK
jgi:hypothetical protein